MTQPPTRSAATVLMRQAEHVLFVGLLVLGAAQSVADDIHPVAVLGVAFCLLAWYALGAAAQRSRRSDRRFAALWLAVLCAGWVVILALSVDLVWLAFPIFLLALQLLPVRWAIPVVGALTAVAVLAFAAHQGGLNAASVIGPVVGAAVAVGISSVYRQLREESEQRARVVAELTATQERLAGAERYAGTVAERERMAHEIHDTLAQSLSSIVMLLRSVSAHGSVLPDGARHQLEVAAGAAQDALEDTRRLVRTLEPTALAGQPLTAVLRRLVDDTATVGIDIRFELDGEPFELPTAVAVAIVRTAQGALGNVVAHSMCGHARVTLTFQPDQVSIDVADDGLGFDPEAPTTGTTAGTGIGLVAMRKRLASVGGRLVVESTPGGGTAVSASIPLEASDA